MLDTTFLGQSPEKLFFISQSHSKRNDLIMKNLLIIGILFLLTLSSPASASLYESIWSSTLGTAETGTWSVDYTFNGIIGTTVSQTGQYLYSGKLTTIGADGASYIVGEISYQPMFSDYAGTLDFLFEDGNRYTAQGTAHNTYFIYRDSTTGAYLGRSDINQHSEALVTDNGVNFLVTFDMIGNFIGYKYDSLHNIIGEQGNVQSISFTVSNVPVPASAWLFISGLAVLAGYRKLKPTSRFI
jgi:hypothetical protein